MSEEKRICPLLSIAANCTTGAMQHCREDKCAWYYADRAMCALEALALNTDHIETGLERAADALGDGIQANLADIADNISDK